MARGDANDWNQQSIARTWKKHCEIKTGESLLRVLHAHFSTQYLCILFKWIRFVQRASHLPFHEMNVFIYSWRLMYHLMLFLLCLSCHFLFFCQPCKDKLGEQRIEKILNWSNVTANWFLFFLLSSKSRATFFLFQLASAFQIPKALRKKDGADEKYAEKVFVAFVVFFFWLYSVDVFNAW